MMATSRYLTAEYLLRINDFLSSRHEAASREYVLFRVRSVERTYDIATPRIRLSLILLILLYQKLSGTIALMGSQASAAYYHDNGRADYTEFVC